MCVARKHYTPRPARITNSVAIFHEDDGTSGICEGGDGSDYTSHLAEPRTRCGSEDRPRSVLELSSLATPARCYVACARAQPWETTPGSGPVAAQGACPVPRCRVVRGWLGRTCQLYHSAYDSGSHGCPGPDKGAWCYSWTRDLGACLRYIPCKCGLVVRPHPPLGATYARCPHRHCSMRYTPRWKATSTSARRTRDSVRLAGPRAVRAPCDERVHAALLAYDLLLNTGREVDLVWRQKWRASTAIYFFLRYPVIAFQIFNVYASAYTTPHCDALYRFTWAFSILLTRVAITASFALRIYAILDLSRIAFAIAAGLGLVGLTAIGLDIWQDIQVSCSTSSNPISTVLTFFLLAAFDVLTTAVLAYRFVALVRLGGIQVMKGQGLISLIINQGLVYFFTVATVQIIVIILYYIPQGVYSLVLNNYALLIASILLSRFLLDLRELHARPYHSMQEDTISAPKFSPVGGSTIGFSARESYSGAPELVRDFSDASSGVLFTSEEDYKIGWSGDELELELSRVSPTADRTA